MTGVNDKIKINLGSGERKKEGYINVDWYDDHKPDVKHNLNVLPYPFPNNYADVVEMSHVLEHLDKPFPIMKEIHRILKPGGIVKIWVPHFSRGFTHAEHEHGFDVTFPMYFTNKSGNSGYYGIDYKIVKMKLSWMAFFHLLPAMGFGPVMIFILRIINSIISFLANLSPALTSRLWCFWVGGFEEIHFEFEAVKK